MNNNNNSNLNSNSSNNNVGFSPLLIPELFDPSSEFRHSSINSISLESSQNEEVNSVSASVASEAASNREAARWSNEATLQLLNALLAYCKDNGLPCGIKHFTAARSAAKA